MGGGDEDGDGSGKVISMKYGRSPDRCRLQQPVLEEVVGLKGLVNLGV